MNIQDKPDSLDIMLYTSMPAMKSKDVEEYNMADADSLPLKRKKKIFRRLHKRIKYSERHAEYRPEIEILKRVATIVLIIISVTFASLLSVKAIRAAIFEVIITWYEESISVKYEEGMSETTTAPSKIFEYREPQVGDEFERYESIKNEYRMTIEYESESTLLVYTQSLLKDYEVMVSNHDTVMQTITINGIDYVITSYNTNGVDYNTVIYNDGEYAYKLNGNISVDVLIRYTNTITATN